jgi:hypothetical protein
MSTFTTTGSTAVTLMLIAGDVRITARDHPDTVVAVRPRDPASAADVAAAGRVAVERIGDEVAIKAPKLWKRLSPAARDGFVDVVIDLPTGCPMSGTIGMGDVRFDGAMGAIRLRTGLGDVRAARAAHLIVASGGGDIVVDHIEGDAEITTSSGHIEIGTIDGSAKITSAQGPVVLGTVHGAAQVKAAKGSIAIERAAGNLTARTAVGHVTISEVANGSIVAETAKGDVTIGVREGTAAWLDLVAHTGNVRNGLDAAAAPSDTEARVQVRARTALGDIAILRSAPTLTTL